MSTANPNITRLGSHRQVVATGSLSTVAAATASAGHLFALRNPSTSVSVRVRRIEVEFLLSAAFGALQEVGALVHRVTGFTALHTGGAAVTMTGNVGWTAQAATVATGRIATTAALTAGTQTFDANALARTTNYTNAVGVGLGKREFDFKDWPLGGIILSQDEGIVIRNSILMGASGTVIWHFGLEWDDLLIT